MVFITLFEDLNNGNAFGQELIDPVTDRYLACASYLVLCAVPLNRAYMGYLECWLMNFSSITRYMRVSFVMKLIAVTGLNLIIYSNGGVTGFLGRLKISLCEDRRLKDTQNLQCEDRRFQNCLVLKT